MAAQKVKEQNQQAEMQKQLMRILGSTAQSDSGKHKDDPLKSMQELHGPDSTRDLHAIAEASGQHGPDNISQQKSSTMKIRTSHDNSILKPPKEYDDEA